MKNKKIVDTFEYHDKWGIGGDCVYCKFCNKQSVKEDWPTDDLRCNLHKISLNIELRNYGVRPSYLNGQYFCKSMEIVDSWEEFSNTFNTIKDDLEEDILYEACDKEYLCMTPFDELEKIEN